MDRTAHFYSQPSYVGAGFPIFSGSRRQRGGGVLGSLARLVLPAVKSVGKALVPQVVGLAGDVVKSVSRGENIGTAIRRQGTRRLANVGRAALSQLSTAIGPAPVAAAAASKRSRKRKTTTANRSASAVGRKRRKRTTTTKRLF